MNPVGRGTASSSALCLRTKSSNQFRTSASRCWSVFSPLYATPTPVHPHSKTICLPIGRTTIFTVVRGLARPRREDVTRGVDGECAPQEHGRSARRDVVVRGAKLWDEREDVGREARRQFGDERFVAGAGLSDECANRDGAALDAALVDDGKELVLQFRARAADLVDEDDLGVPDALRRGEVVELRARGVRHRHAHEDAYCITLPFRPQGGAARRS